MLWHVIRHIYSLEVAVKDHHLNTLHLSHHIGTAHVLTRIVLPIKFLCQQQGLTISDMV
jgi:hypothetical protein